MKTFSAKPKEVERQWHLVDLDGLTLGRAATPRELEWARGLLADQGINESQLGKQHWEEFCHTMLNRKELIYVY